MGNSDVRTEGANHAWKYADPYQWMEHVRAGLEPLIITCALNGGIQGKEAHPNIPETPEEIAAAAHEAYNAGASMVHVHVRNPTSLWETTCDAESILEVNALIRERCPDLIINVTTGGGPTTTMEERLQGLAAQPEMASLNMGPDMSRFKIAPRPAPLPHPHDGLDYDDCIPFTYRFIKDLARRMLELDIKPEMEIYQPGQYWVTRFLIDEDLVKPPYVHQFVMGYQTSSFPTPENLCGLVRELPEDSVFFACGIGVYQLPMTTMATLMGGHVRVGLEDNLYYSRGQKFRGNGEAVERAVEIARQLNREVATPAQAREMLGISQTPRAYARSKTETPASS